MGQEQGFLDDIFEKPEDDAPRLIYADCLEEHGQAERAEFIRLQIELARPGQALPAPAALTHREQELLQAHGEEWAGCIPDLIGARWVIPKPALRSDPRQYPRQVVDPRNWEFRRGFVEGITVQTETFLRNADQLFRTAPIREVRLSDANVLTDELARCRHLARLRTLRLTGGLIGADAARCLFSSEYLGGLESLALAVEPTGLRELVAASERLPGLKELHLYGSRLDDQEAVCEMLAAVPPGCWNSLSVLHLNETGIGDRVLQALASTAWSETLTELFLGENGENGVTASGAGVFATSGRFSRLKKLDLHMSSLGDDGLEALAAADLPELCSLSLWSNGFEVRSLAALVRSRFWPQMVDLDLSQNPFGDPGAKELLAAPRPPRLASLRLVGCEISEPLRTALQGHIGASACRFE